MFLDKKKKRTDSSEQKGDPVPYAARRDSDHTSPCPRREREGTGSRTGGLAR